MRGGISNPLQSCFDCRSLGADIQIPTGDDEHGEEAGEDQSLLDIKESWNFNTSIVSVESFAIEKEGNKKDGYCSDI